MRLQILVPYLSCGRQILSFSCVDIHVSRAKGNALKSPVFHGVPEPYPPVDFQLSSSPSSTNHMSIRVFLSHLLVISWWHGILLCADNQTATSAPQSRVSISAMLSIW
ncbi:hypothetical protein EV356DRAFT_377323 [Viridothelium virens]|uniref:Uncharacterized protein n=1 Tax=Viridothelium virens TaxID=1048519 RepID=A0A6A6GUX6_VIRVR|nr:hypothetical protein EV356DRAFT_377323 [Viridothelium virens]